MPGVIELRATISHLQSRLGAAEAVCNAYDLFRTSDVRMKAVDDAFDKWKGL